MRKWIGIMDLERPRAVLILEESSLELLPKKFHRDEGALKLERAFGMEPEMQILNANFHRKVISSLDDREKRGRPDVVHFALLDATSTPLFLRGEIEVVLHARGRDAIVLKRGTRPPRTLERFCGVMAKLLSHHEGIEEQRLFRVLRNLSFKELVENLNVEEVVALSRLGARRTLEEVTREQRASRTAFVVGGFARGHFRENVISSSNEVVSISEESLAAHVVTARICYELEKQTE